MGKILDKIEKYILYLTIFIFPIAFLSVSPNPFVVSKLIILTYGVLLILLLRSLKIILSGKLDLNIGSFDIPLLIISVSFVISTILRTPNKMEAILLPGTMTAIVFAILLYFIINQFEDRIKLPSVLSYSAAFFSILTLLAASGVFGLIPQLPPYIKSKAFSPEGGYLPTAIFLLTILPISIAQILTSKEKVKKLLAIFAALIITAGIALSVYNLLPGKPTSPRFPRFSTSWNIAIDSLKDSPIFGIGPGNYLTAFNRFRPLSYNQTDLWPIKFTTANSFYLTYLTEVGLLGTAGLVFLLLSFYRTAKTDFKEKKTVSWGFAGNANLISLITLVILLFIFPATPLLTFLFFILFAFNSRVRHTSLNLTTQETPKDVHTLEQAQKLAVSRFPAFLISIPIIILVIYSGIRATNIVRAEYKFNKALSALASNQASLTYDTIREAIRLNPRVDRYHATFSRINLALANSIAQKKDITDQDRSTITILIQQAINESKAAVALNPLRSNNWEILAQTYRSIIPLAKGADTFAIQSYRNAIALDPINPNLRIELGGIYYAKGDFENAVKAFELAVAAKPDHANARYNYAFALSGDKKLDRAIEQMTMVLSLIKDKSGKDYEAAKKALEDFQNKKKAVAPQGEELTPPQPAPSPVITPPVELPQGSEPPEAPLSPTPTLTSTPTPTP